MRVAIYGLREGHHASMIKSALAAPNAHIVGVVEDSDEHYERWHAQHGWPRYATLDDLIEQARPELIIEGVHHAAKTELVLKAAAAGIHLLFDKPLCTSLHDWHTMKQAVDESGIEISMWFTARSYPPFMKLRECVMNGELGQLVSFISTHPHRLGTKRPAWYADPQVYTGTFHDLACHGVDQIRWLSGAEYSTVHAVATSMVPRTVYGPAEDHVQASFKLSDGACAAVTADWLTPDALPAFGDTRFIVTGTKGSAHVRAYAEDHVLVVNDRRLYEPDLSAVQAPPFVEHLIETIKKDEPLYVPTEDVFAVAKACLMAQQSAKEGGTLLHLDAMH